MKSLVIAVLPWPKKDLPLTAETVVRMLPSIVLMDGYELVLRLESERVIVEFRESVAHNSSTGIPTP